MSAAVGQLAFPKAENRSRIHLPQRTDIWEHATSGMAIKRIEVVEARDLPRRERCRRELAAFKATYFPHWFTDPCRYHDESTARKQAATLLNAPIVYQAAEAAPRSIGKTTDCRAWAIWCILYGHTDYVLFLTVNADKGEDHIKAIKAELLTNSILADDFPEICSWVRSFNGDARRCKILFPNLEWNDNELHFQTGAWICAAGMDSGLPGMNKGGKRPKIIILEDPEDLKIAGSRALRQALHDRIYMEALKLHDVHQKAIYWFVCTIYARGSVADEITDPKQRPEWRGKRYPAIESWPERRDLVEMFALLYRERAFEIEKLALAEAAATCEVLKIAPAAFEILTIGHQRALRFYVANRSEIERGASVLDPVHLPLHRCLEEWAKDEKSFAYQYQNDPPEDKNRKTLQLDVEYLLGRRVGEGRGIVPSWARVLTAAIDVGAYVLHWEVDAWDAELETSCLIDQGQQETNLNTGGEYKMESSAQAREVLVRLAIKRALETLYLKLSAGYPTSLGEKLFLSLTGIDCGGTAEKFAWYEIVLTFCRKSPRLVGMKGETWSRSIADRAIGRSWICEQINNPMGRHDCNADEYKKRVSDAFFAVALNEAGLVNPGARILHRDTPQIYATQQTAEYWIEQVATEDVPAGKEIKLGWNKRPGVQNHWWDTAWMNYCAADILKFLNGIKRQRPKYGRLGRAF